MGFVLATAAIEIDLPGYPLVTRAAVPWLILAVPLFDMSLVVLSRWRGGRPVFRGGTDHSSHRLVAIGASSRQAAVVTYVTGALAGGGSLIVLVAKNPAVTLTIAAIAVALAAGLGLALERVPLGTTGTAEEAGVAARSGVT